MSPTIFYDGQYRFFFFSKEEQKIHVHVMTTKGEAKFWIEPIVSLAENYGLTSKDLTKIQQIVQERKSEIKNNWKKHFQS